MIAGGRNEGWVDHALRLAPQLPPPFRRLAARRAARRGLAAPALRAAPDDPIVLARVGAHLQAGLTFGGGRESAAARSASLAAMGNLDLAREQALAAAPLSGGERRFLAACVAPIDPMWAFDLLPARAYCQRAACALAAGRLDLAEIWLARAKHDQQARYVGAALAAWRGDWRAARARLNRAFVMDGLAAPLCEDSAEATVLDAFGGRRSQFTPATGPLVSVVMAARDAAKTLATAVRSVLAQTWSDLELLIVDDRSGDGTLSLAHALAQQDDRIRVLTNSRAPGAYGARNTALAGANGEFVAMHDADDWAHPQRIELQMAAIGRGGAVSLCRYFRLDSEGRPLSPRTFPFARLSPITLLARAEAFRGLGFFEETAFGADSEWLARADERLGRRACARLSEVAYVALWRPGSLTHSGGAKLYGDEAKRRATYVGEWRARHAAGETAFASEAASD